MKRDTNGQGLISKLRLWNLVLVQGKVVQCLIMLIQDFDFFDFLIIFLQFLNQLISWQTPQNISNKFTLHKRNWALNQLLKMILY